MECRCTQKDGATPYMADVDVHNKLHNNWQVLSHRFTFSKITGLSRLQKFEGVLKEKKAIKKNRFLNVKM